MQISESNIRGRYKKSRFSTKLDMLPGNSVYPDHQYKMTLTLQLLVLLGLSSGLWMGANVKPCKTCPEGWFNYKSRCFLFNHELKERHDAESFCLGKEGNLASIADQDELNFVKQLVVQLTGKNQGTWLGGTDAVKESVWRWSDGSAWSSEFWGDGEPNNHGGNENCMHLRDADGFPVNDVPCDIKQSVLCSREVAERD
ncbi:galactose-specific lectin nattectin-like [Xyrichtys novacula]|uniref:Galactose-specific lectin nattectin-like n=1 Tax=Xyrichtys novacula TaxID=13765 RepID=A0AAV1FDH6_XYRNO|nr:galactose-specific lectin nattectin-like [Xyrichtys novacula]